MNLLLVRYLTLFCHIARKSRIRFSVFSNLFCYNYWFQNFIQAIASPESVAYAQELTQKAVLNQVRTMCLKKIPKMFVVFGFLSRRLVVIIPMYFIRRYPGDLILVLLLLEGKRAWVPSQDSGYDTNKTNKQTTNKNNNNNKTEAAIHFYSIFNIQFSFLFFSRVTSGSSG